MSATPTRWGIVSAGKISSDFAAAMKLLPESEHRVVAVAARALHDATTFANKYGIGKAYGSYHEMAMDPEIEVVYVGTVNCQHLPVATMMMRAGKHVLCEKPLCVNVKETKQMIRVAQEQRVFMMEAIWSRFFPVYEELVRQVRSGQIGEVQHVIASFGRDLRGFYRILNRELSGGVTLDLGVYPVQFASLMMGGEKPLKVIAGGHLHPQGVDESMGATLVYSNGRLATVTSTMNVSLPSEAVVVGTKGTLKVNSPMWCPDSLDTPSGKLSFPLPQTSHKFNFRNSQGLIYEAMEVRRCITEGLLESPGMPHSETLTVAEIMEQIRMQVGTVYAQDL